MIATHKVLEILIHKPLLQRKCDEDAIATGAAAGSGVQLWQFVKSADQLPIKRWQLHFILKKQYIIPAIAHPLVHVPLSYLMDVHVYPHHGMKS